MQQQSSSSQNDWNKTLNANVAGAATNAEDFTKQFMSDMFGGSSGGQQQQPPVQPSIQPPMQQQVQQKQVQQQQQSSSSSQNEWNNTLNANVAGAASNAEDFTKQFMSDMFGGGSSGQQQGSKGENLRQF